MIWFLVLHLPKTKNPYQQWKQTRNHDAGGLEDCRNNWIPKSLLGNLRTIGFQSVPGCINNILLLVELLRQGLMQGK